MRQAFLACSAAILTMVGCAAQAPADQITSRETVRICEGNRCSEQPRNLQTFQPAAGDAMAEQRLQALTQLAEQNPRAAYDLGLRLLRGDSVQRDPSQAIEWLRKAGNQGLLDAQVALGSLYLQGLEEMGSDPAEAESWLSRAAAQGHRESQRLLPQAQAAKSDAQALFQVREAQRKSWGLWYSGAPYYWHWGAAGWYLH